jgi:NSS family neurotransmitter:Na+ symporter
LKTEAWSSRLTFLCATITCSVGLGNLWRFPYVAGENGGGAFVLVYIGFVVGIGIPLIMAELAIARRGHASPVATTAAISQEEAAHSHWQVIGWLSILAPLLALSFYSVIGGWSLDYLVQSAAGAFDGIDGTGAAALFTGLLDSPERMLVSYTLMLVSVSLVVGSGIRRGIERVSKFMMPALFALLVLLALYANVVGDAGRAWSFLFTPDFSKLTANSVLIALGQSLFSIAVGTGALLAYGAYLPKHISIPSAAWAIGLADTGAALLAGLLIFPIVFASGLDAAEGPGLIFVTLPVAFSQMPGAQLFGPALFLLIFFAAFTSGLGMMEPFVSWAEEQQGMNRRQAATLTGILVWTLGLAAVFSFNLWKEFTPLDFIPQLEGRTVFSLLDYVVSNFMLPLNAMLIALLAGWVINAQRMRDDIGIAGDSSWSTWQLSVRVLAPVGVVSVFLFNLLS